MTVCLACYEDRLASLFENAPSFRLFDVDDTGAAARGELDAPRGDALALGAAMAARGVDTLVCGGISGASRRLLLQHGVTVQPWISGTVDEVLAALGQGTLAALAMPGVPCAGGGMGLGRGMGGGRGMGLGGGRGMGTGRGAGMGGGAGRGMGMGGGGRKATASGPGLPPAAGLGLGLGPCGQGLRRGPAGRGAVPPSGAPDVPAAPGFGPGFGPGRGAGLGSGMNRGLGRGGRRGR
jgi:predicted Fe-Mo cluster-binding NifX family protein